MSQCLRQAQGALHGPGRGSSPCAWKWQTCQTSASDPQSQQQHLPGPDYVPSAGILIRARCNAAWFEFQVLSELRIIRGNNERALSHQLLKISRERGAEGLTVLCKCHRQVTAGSMRMMQDWPTQSTRGAVHATATHALNYQCHLSSTHHHMEPGAHH